MPSIKMNGTKGDYSAYNREYTTDLAAYETRETNLLGWHTTYSVDRLGVSMTVDIDGTIRYTQAIDAETTPHGDFFLSRGILTDDAPSKGTMTERSECSKIISSRSISL